MSRSPTQGPFKTRNLNCIYYAECLDRAAKDDWPDFSCCFCPHKHSNGGKYPDDCEIEGCWALLGEVFEIRIELEAQITLHIKLRYENHPSDWPLGQFPSGIPRKF